MSIILSVINGWLILASQKKRVVKILVGFLLLDLAFCCGFDPLYFGDQILEEEEATIFIQITIFFFYFVSIITLIMGIVR